MKETNMANWINPKVPYSDLTIGEADERVNWVHLLKEERDNGRISHQAYDEICDLMLG